MVYYHLTLSPWLHAWMWEIHYKDRASACAAWNHDPTRKVMNVHAKSGSCSLAPVTHAQKPVSGNQSSGMSIWLQPNLSQKGFLVKLFAKEFSNQLSADQVDKWWLAGGCWSVSKTRKALLPVISMQSAMQWFTQWAIIIGTNVCVHICHHLKDMPFGVLHVEIKSPFALRDDVITPTHCVSHHVVVA